MSEEKKEYPNIRKALLVAQRSITPVEKDARNEFHKYDYVSSEAMLIAARHALHDAGLTAERNEWLYDASVCKVIMYFEVAHAASGEARRYPVEWPIVEDKGRPFDKALAGALTTSFNYWLRDLLLVPRKDEAEVDRRDDTGHAPPKAGGAKKAANTAQGKSAAVEAAPKFDKANRDHQQKLIEALEKRKVPVEHQDDIAVALHGKNPFKDLDEVIAKVTAAKANSAANVQA